MIRKLDSIFNNMKDSVCVFNTHGQITYANVAAGVIFECERESLLNKRVWEIIPLNEKNDDFIQLFIDSVMEKQSFHEAIVEFYKNNGSVSKLRVSLSNMEGLLEDEQGTIVIMTDLTELEHIHNTFIRFTSDSVAEAILKTPDGEKMGGKSRDISIMITDLRGFTAISNNTSANRLITMMNHYFEKMSEVIEKYEGTLIELLGDGMFVIFGAPNDVSDYEKKAVACAVEMQNCMPEVNSWNVENGFPEIEMGIGINTGTAIVGNLGSTKATRFGCLGQEVNMAGRIESVSTGGQVLISQSTMERIGDQLLISDKLQYFPKGAESSIDIYEVKGLVGDFNLILQEKEVALKPVVPIEIRFSVIQAKEVVQKTLICTLRELCKTHALIQTESKLEKYSNLVLDIGDNLYAKIVDVREDGYAVCFTYKPEGFDSWMESVME